MPKTFDETRHKLIDVFSLSNNLTRAQFTRESVKQDMNRPSADVTGIVQKAVDPETGLRLTEMDALANADIFMYLLVYQWLTCQSSRFRDHCGNLDFPSVPSPCKPDILGPTLRWDSRQIPLPRWNHKFGPIGLAVPSGYYLREYFSKASYLTIALRLRPAATSNFPREVPRGGTVIAGQYISAGVSPSIKLLTSDYRKYSNICHVTWQALLLKSWVVHPRTLDWKWEGGGNL